MGSKLEKLETQSKKAEKDNKLELENIRKEITDGLTELEENLTDKVVDKIKPKITELEIKIKGDMRNVVHE